MLCNPKAHSWESIGSFHSFIHALGLLWSFPLQTHHLKRPDPDLFPTFLRTIVSATRCILTYPLIESTQKLPDVGRLAKKKPGSLSLLSHFFWCIPMVDCVKEDIDIRHEKLFSSD